MLPQVVDGAILKISWIHLVLTHGMFSSESIVLALFFFSRPMLPQVVDGAILKISRIHLVSTHGMLKTSYKLYRIL